MKNIVRTGLFLALISAIAPSAFATDTGFNLPDGGSTAVMLAVAVAGIGALRKFRR